MTRSIPVSRFFQWLGKVSLSTVLISTIGLVSHPSAPATASTNPPVQSTKHPTHRASTDMSIAKLSAAEVETQLKQLEGWSLQAGKLHREFKFASFVEAFGFMSSLALVSETLGHHPEWLNVYNRITIDLTSHDAGGITMKDIEWARKANELSKLHR